MKIKSITISGMHNIIGKPKTYTFKDVNYLIGKNGAGKSTVLQAIQLAILGYLPGTAKRVSEIFNHASSRSMTLDLKLTDDENVTDNSPETARIVRSWLLKGRDIQSKLTVTPEDFTVSELISQIELPIFNFSEFLGLSRNQMKTWFLNFLPKPKCSIDWKQEFESTLLENGYVLLHPEYVDEVIADGTEGDEGLESVQMTNTKLKELLAEKKIEVARLEGAVQALIFYDDISTEDYDESKASLENCLNDIKKLRKSVYDANQAKALHDRRIDEISRLESMLTSESQRVEDLEILDNADSIEQQYSDEVVDISNKVSEVLKKLADVNAAIDSSKAIISGKGICPYTKSSCESILDYIKSLDVASLEAEKSKLEHDKVELNKQLHVIESHFKEAKSKISNARFRSANDDLLNSKINKLKSNLAELSEAELQLLDTSLTDLDAKESSIQDELSKIESNHAYESKINEITSSKYQAENELEALKLFIKRTDANNMQTEIAALPFKEFQDKMNEIIPDLFGQEVSFRVNLESKANSFSFGIAKYPVNNNDIYVPYDLMSSGEKTLLAFAMMVYIVTQSSAKLKLVMIDDMLDHLDNTNIVSLFEKFSNTSVQVINAGVKEINNDTVNIIQI